MSWGEAYYSASAPLQDELPSEFRGLGIRLSLLPYRLVPRFSSKYPFAFANTVAWDLVSEFFTMTTSLDFSIPQLFDVKGKVAVITGGGSGIGTMIATALVQNGAKVWIASRKEQQLKEVSDALNAKGPGKCEYVVADIGNKAGCDALCAHIKSRESKIHILVNNSGATWGAPLTDFPEAQGWDKIMALNVKSIFYMTVGLVDLLAQGSDSSDPARVINISSIASFSTMAQDTILAAGGTGLWSYNTSKAAVNHLTSLLAVSLAPRHITVNAILPGIFPSKMTAWGLGQSGDKVSQVQPAGRFGTPQDMAGVALFLTSRASAHVNGAHIILDGGALISKEGHAKL